MLTFVLRSERFGDGMWSAGITSGVVRMLLERVGVLLKEGVFPEETSERGTGKVGYGDYPTAGGRGAAHSAVSG